VHSRGLTVAASYVRAIVRAACSRSVACRTGQHDASAPVRTQADPTAVHARRRRAASPSLIHLNMMLGPRGRKSKTEIKRGICRTPMEMWYPNRAQWRVIWLLAAFFSLLGAVAAVNGDSGLVLIMILIDGALLAWKLQRGGK